MAGPREDPDDAPLREDAELRRQAVTSKILRLTERERARRSPAGPFLCPSKLRKSDQIANLTVDNDSWLTK